MVGYCEQSLLHGKAQRGRGLHVATREKDILNTEPNQLCVRLASTAMGLVSLAFEPGWECQARSGPGLRGTVALW